MFAHPAFNFANDLHPLDKVHPFLFVAAELDHQFDGDDAREVVFEEVVVFDDSRVIGEVADRLGFGLESRQAPGGSDEDNE